MQFIPEKSAAEIGNIGEREIYAKLLALKSDIRFERWIVYHSMTIPFSIRKANGEIDFLILTPNNLIGLEVKTGFREVRDRVWHYEKYSKAEDPYTQVMNALHATKLNMQDSFSRRGGNTGPLHVAGAVLFPDRNFYGYEHLECPADLVYDSRSHQRTDGMADFLLGIHDSICRTNNLAALAEIPTEIWLRVRNYLDGRFKAMPSLFPGRLNNQIRQAEFTETQSAVLSAYGQQPRILVDGAAGTGKTLLARIAAVNGSNSGKRSALILFNKLIAQWLTCNNITHTAEFDIMTADALYLQVANLIFGSDRTAAMQRESGGYNDAFREKIINDIIGTNLPENLKYDYLVIDEGQDLMNDENIDLLLEVLLKGGVAEGNWAIFYDSNLQSRVYGALSRSSLEKLRKHAIQFKLDRNCRNTEKIIRNMVRLTGYQYEAPHFPTAGPVVEPLNYDGDKSQIGRLKQLIRVLTAEGVELGSIDVISACGLEASVLTRMKGPITAMGLREMTSNNVCNRRDTIQFTSVYKYKGLENDFIIITDLNALNSEQHQAVLYTAMSRARYKLYILVSKEAEQEFARLNQKEIL